MDLSIEFAHGESLIGNDLADLVDLAAVFSEEVEQVIDSFPLSLLLSSSLLFEALVALLCYLWIEYNNLI